jgi:putative heme-binding domain-containing protein
MFDKYYLDELTFLMEMGKEFSQEYETVSVVTQDGTAFQGVMLNEDSFTVQMMDAREQIHSFDKAQLKSYEKTRISLMPAYDTNRLSEKDLDDLVAYLLKLSTEPGGAQ